VFERWSDETTTLKKMIETYGGTSNIQQALSTAHNIWLKLKDAFNKEAQTYVYGEYESELGSVGVASRREVLRSLWWDLFEGDSLGDYDEITFIIELLHHGEKLETGTILFGS